MQICLLNCTLKSLFKKDNIWISPGWQKVLSQQGLRSLDDFIKYASGEVVSKLRKRPVRRIIIFHNAVSYCVYLKQQRQYSFMHWFRLMRKPRNDRLASTRESVILEMCRESKIPVMETIAVGERSILEPVPASKIKTQQRLGALKK